MKGIVQVGCIPDVGWKALLLPLLLSWYRSFGWEEQECYSLSAACGSIGIANLEINRGGVKNHVDRYAIARAMKGQISQTRKAKDFRLKRVLFFPCIGSADAAVTTFGTNTKMLLVWARCFPRSAGSEPLISVSIDHENVHFSSFRWGIAKGLPAHCP